MRSRFPVARELRVHEDRRRFPDPTIVALFFDITRSIAALEVIHAGAVWLACAGPAYRL